MKRLLSVSIGINILLIVLTALLYLKMKKEVVTSENTIRGGNGQILMESETKAYITESELLPGEYRYVKVTERKGFYPNGKLRYKATLIDGNYEDCFSYDPDGKPVCEFVGGSGKLLIPNSKGEIPSVGTYDTYAHLNCYFRNGEALSKAEYDRREEIQDKRIDSIMKGPTDLNRL